MTDLGIDVSDSFLDRLADAVARKMYEGSAAHVAENTRQEAPGRTETREQAPAYTPGRAGAQNGSQGQGGATLDPWQSAGTTTVQNPGYAPNVAPVSAQTGSSAPAAVPSCQHGPMKYVPAGFSQRTGKPYPAFWSCQMRDRAQQCPTVQA